MFNSFCETGSSSGIFLARSNLSNSFFKIKDISNCPAVGRFGIGIGSTIVFFNNNLSSSAFNKVDIFNCSGV